MNPTAPRALPAARSALSPAPLASPRTTAATSSPATDAAGSAASRFPASAPLPSFAASAPTSSTPIGGARAPSTALAARATAAAAALPTTMAIQDGATHVPDRATFETLAVRDDVPGAAGVLAMKFVIADADTTRPKAFLMNSSTRKYHFDFARDLLGVPDDVGGFNAMTYFTDRRKFIAGTIVAHDSFQAQDGTRGVYALEFWPTDPVKARHVGRAFRALEASMPFLAGNLKYHPAGDTQEQLAATPSEAASFRRQQIPSISTATLFEGVQFSALNPGEGYGVLRVADGPQASPPSVRDVVIFKAMPNDLSHVGGIITEQPQTPLSHINLKAKQNHTPNAYIKDAANDPRIAPLIGKTVHFQVTPTGFDIRAATSAEAEQWLDSVRPTLPQLPRSDLTEKDVVSFARLGHGDAAAFGAKTANIAELAKILPTGMVPEGYGIPFSFYDEFMEDTGLNDDARTMMADPAFKTDVAAREKALKDFRKKVKNTAVPAALETKLKALQGLFGDDVPVRCRSSTNNEDLVDFNGAGLYDSYTHRPGEGDLSKTVKQVWASLWNFRAFEERDFYRVDHFAAKMAVAVHPNTDDELVNGVAFTKNIYDENWPGFYVNAQKGEILVTNPDPSTTPDEFLISAIGPRGEYETQFIRHSSLATDGKPLLSQAQTMELVSAMEKIQSHFKTLYGRDNDKTFAMDLEWKIDKNGALLVKQARPVL